MLIINHDISLVLMSSFRSGSLFSRLRFALPGALTASSIVLGAALNAQAQVAYEFSLPALMNGCLSSPTHPDCYADRNVIRASGFSHDDGTGAPQLMPTSSVPPLLKKPTEDPSGIPLWQRLKETLSKISSPLHVIDQSKPKTFLSTIAGQDIFTDTDYNQWSQFSGDWYVMMSNQFNRNSARKRALWCGELLSCDGFRNYADAPNKGASPLFFAPVLTESAPQALKDKINLGDWLRARPQEYDVTMPETVNARANFLVGGRGIGSSSSALDKASWNSVAYVWVDPDYLFRPAQNPDITKGNIASVTNHFDPVQPSPTIDWCIKGMISTEHAPGSCAMAEPSLGQGTLFDNFDDYYQSYFASGSNPLRSDFFPFPFTGLGVTYDPYYQALLESASTEADLALVVPKLIGTSEFIYGLPPLGQADSTRMYVDRVFPITGLVHVPGPLPILGAGAGWAFSRRLRCRIRCAAPFSSGGRSGG